MDQDLKAYLDGMNDKLAGLKGDVAVLKLEMKEDIAAVKRESPSHTAAFQTEVRSQA